MKRSRLFVMCLVLFISTGMAVWAEGVREVEKEVIVEVPVEKEVIVEKMIPGDPYGMEAFRDVPEEIGVIRSDALHYLSLEQQFVVKAAFKRAYQELMNSEFDPGMPAGGDQVHFWAGRDTNILAQNLAGGDGLDGNNWGIPNFVMIAMNPTATEAFIVKDEFINQYSTGREDEYGGNGPDGYGAPLSNEYYYDGVRYQAFEKGLMIVEDGEADFIPEPLNQGELLANIPEGIGVIREDAEKELTKYEQEAVTAAFRRAYFQLLMQEFDPGVPAGGDEVHFWAGRDANILAQNLTGGDGLDGNNWGIPNLVMLAMNPGTRKAFAVRNEFINQFSTGREDDYGGNGPDGYGAPITSEYYHRDGYVAQLFEKGLMILEDGEVVFIPNN